MEILEKLPSVTVSRYHLLHREHKRYNTPPNRPSQSAVVKFVDDEHNSSKLTSFTPETPRSYYENRNMMSPSPTPLKSILKPTKFQSYNEQQDIQALQALLNNLNRPEEHIIKHRARSITPKHSYRPGKKIQEKSNEELPPVHELKLSYTTFDERKLQTRLPAKSVSFKLDTNLNEKQSGSTRSKGEAEWTLMVGPTSRSPSRIKQSRKTLISPIIEEKPQSIREVVMNEIKQYYNTENAKASPSLRLPRSPDENYRRSIRGKRNSSSAPTPTVRHELHTIADPYRRFLKSRGTTSFGIEALPLRPSISSESRTRRLKPKSKSSREVFSSHQEKNR